MMDEIRVIERPRAEWTFARLFYRTSKFSFLADVQHHGHAPDHKRMHSKQNSCAQTGMMVLSRKGCKQMVQCSCSRPSSLSLVFWLSSGGDSNGSSLTRFDDGDDAVIFSQST